MFGTLLYRRFFPFVILAVCILHPLPVRGDDDSTLESLYSQSQDALHQGDRATAFSALAQAHEKYPKSDFVQRQIEDITEGGLPDTISENLANDLPVETVTLSDGLGLLITPKDYLVTRLAEPQHGWEFRKICYLYRQFDAQDLQKFQLFCRVHYIDSDDADLAARIARLLSLAGKTLVAKTGHLPGNGDKPFDVWLCNTGQSGGEEWQDNLYFYDLKAPRSSIEWIREIVHEYSHLALPAIGGYQKPEYWANGYIGERLIIRWFQRIPNGKAQVEENWGDFSGAGNFDRLLITPALDLYRRTGPNKKWLARRDEQGMRYLIGQILTIDDKYGSKILGMVFDDLPKFREITPADVSEALSVVKQTHAAVFRTK
jgi:hypothetical protein